MKPAQCDLPDLDMGNRIQAHVEIASANMVYFITRDFKTDPRHDGEEIIRFSAIQVNVYAGEPDKEGDIPLLGSATFREEDRNPLMPSDPPEPPRVGKVEERDGYSSFEMDMELRTDQPVAIVLAEHGIMIGDKCVTWDEASENGQFHQDYSLAIYAQGETVGGELGNLLCGENDQRNGYRRGLFMALVEDIDFILAHSSRDTNGRSPEDLFLDANADPDILLDLVRSMPWEQARQIMGPYELTRWLEENHPEALEEAAWADLKSKGYPKMDTDPAMNETFPTYPESVFSQDHPLHGELPDNSRPENWRELDSAFFNPSKARDVRYPKTTTLAARHRIGEHELCGPDYRLVCALAENVRMMPEEVLKRLLETPDWQKRFRLLMNVTVSKRFERWNTRIENGRFKALRFGKNTLSISSLPSIAGLIVETLVLQLQEAPARLDLSLFPNLTGLSCGANSLTELDLSHVPNLTELCCDRNRLTELDLSHVPNLTELWCYENQLTELDLSNVPSLTKLSCHKNKLTELDLSHVPDLTDLSCGDNSLIKLDLSHVSSLTNLSCHKNKLTELDLSHAPNLTELGCSHNHLTELDLFNVPNLKKLDCDGNKLAELDLSQVSKISKLLCGFNQLTELDLSNVPNLTELHCHWNQLTELDLSNVPNLTELECDKNQLAELDLSQFPNLTVLKCNRNQLTELDLSNVPNLTELECGKNQLTELDLSQVPNLTVLQSYGNQLTELDLSHVPNLTGLGCGENQLTELDLSQVPNITWLECSDNQLAELDLSQVPNLTDLSCYYNQLTELDLSQVPDLTELECHGNQLTELDISDLWKLDTLKCDPSTRLIQHSDQNF